MIFSSKLDIFLSGEICDLCIPTEEYALKSDWYNMFNSRCLTKYLDHGLFPNTPKAQVEFLENASSSDRLVLIVSDKTDYIGVISLSNICFKKRSAGLAIVIDNRKNMIGSPFVAIESICLLTKHAFVTLGLERIESGHHQDLAQWQHRKELIGYRFEGISRNKFRRGLDTADIINSSIILEDYNKIVAHRGDLWDSMHKMKSRILNLSSNSKSSFYSSYRNGILLNYNKYYEDLFFKE